MNSSAIYVHIPFCDHKCIYCDFYSLINYGNVYNYLSALKKEINFQSQFYKASHKFNTIFFGGGTPSFMEPGYIGEIISHLFKNFSFGETVEITMETNPGTVDFNKLKEFKSVGINRISFGVQSFDENELKFLTRIHDRQTAIDNINAASRAGFENISLDLIFNLPRQTKEKWLLNMETALTLPVKHISAYSLILERGTVLNKMVLDGKVKMQDEDYDAELYELTIGYLKSKGFEQYEVSNFCLPGYKCIHNLAYWRYKDYLGFGTSAHSFMNGKRWWNYSALNFYLTNIDKKENAVAGEEIISESQKLNEYVMLALRSSGLDTNELIKKFGDSWLTINKKYINRLIENKILIKQNNFLKFAAKGYALCDEVLRKFN
ncbi:MAG: radical SAM family heme chaperone HemW [Ignavibacteria bacterium]|jgi:oxygen-independent coproporphyrinogen-3 oxidase